MLSCGGDLGGDRSERAWGVPPLALAAGLGADGLLLGGVVVVAAAAEAKFSSWCGPLSRAGGGGMSKVGLLALLVSGPWLRRLSEPNWLVLPPPHWWQARTLRVLSSGVRLPLQLQPPPLQLRPPPPPPLSLPLPLLQLLTQQLVAPLTDTPFSMFIPVVVPTAALLSLTLLAMPLPAPLPVLLPVLLPAPLPVLLPAPLPVPVPVPVLLQVPVPVPVPLTTLILSDSRPALAAVPVLVTVPVPVPLPVLLLSPPLAPITLRGLLPATRCCAGAQLPLLLPRRLITPDSKRVMVLLLPPWPFWLFGSTEALDPGCCPPLFELEAGSAAGAAGVVSLCAILRSRVFPLVTSERCSAE